MPVLEKKLIHPMRERFHDYLKDESMMMGAAESISFPENEAEIGKILQAHLPNTPQLPFLALYASHQQKGQKSTQPRQGHQQNILDIHISEPIRANYTYFNID